MRPRVLAALVLFLLPLTAGPVRAQLLAPLVIGWEEQFSLDWEGGERRGRHVVRGTLTNTSSWTATRIQLLVERLDDSGRVLAQQVNWLGGELSPGSRSHFEIAVPEPAPVYRVSVFAYDRKLAGPSGN